ncbi:MAG TPA: amino acid permease [Streptosporangiaceae bacterium]|nr:amino acid permease [Streptosporangiaceae bacterium]
MLEAEYVAVRRAAGLLSRGDDLPETFSYSLKRRLLGPPLVNDQLSEERLSKPLALGVLSCDGISSANYGSELILHELLPLFGVAAFTILLPMTGVILLGIAFVVLSYREVVTVYTRAGGSYVVARENFGPRVAQVAAVALMVDYIVTVAVQTAAGSQAILSAFPILARPLGDTTTLLIIAVAATLIMCFVNLRGVRENGKTFALPTYLFSGSVILMILVGVCREAFGGGLPHVAWHSGTVAVGHGSSSLLAFAAIYTLAKAYANGGSSLTGIEAVSNAVSALRPPEGRNARQLLVMQGCIVGFLIAGISWLAHITHAIPYTSGVPTVLSQEARLIFGHTVLGTVLFYVLQVGAASILFTGGNTSFSGFPFLASFVAQDSFLPRWLSKRGHRLVFSNGIVVLTILALALLLAVGANTNNLVPFYAIGVFTGFSMAGFGMVRYHLRHREQGWRRRLIINLTGGIYTVLVVIIFAIVKFTEGAWLVIVIFPIGVFAFIRLNREYRAEDQVLEGIGDRQAAGVAPRPQNYTRRVVLVLVDSMDLATLAALRYARSLRPTSLRAVHFVIDTAKADQLQERWLRLGQDVPFEMIDTPDRRVEHAAQELVRREAGQPGTQVTVVLPRRGYSPLIGRLLHDRTADKIAAAVSRIPNAAATIIPFDVESRVRVLEARQAERDGQPVAVVEATGPRTANGAASAGSARPTDANGDQRAGVTTVPRPGGAAEAPRSGPSEAAGPDSASPPPPASPAPASSRAAGGSAKPGSWEVRPIGSLAEPGRAVVEGRVISLAIRPVEQNSVLAVEITDGTGTLTALFYGRKQIPGVICGSKLRLQGPAGFKTGRPVMINPLYELVAAETAD